MGTVVIQNGFKAVSPAMQKQLLQVQAGFDPSVAGSNTRPAGSNPFPDGSTPHPAGSNQLPAGYNPGAPGIAGSDRNGIADRVPGNCGPRMSGAPGNPYSAGSNPGAPGIAGS